MVLFSEKCTVRLDGKTAIVTGSNTGIGKETVKELYKRGARVLMACRNTQKAEEAAKDIINSCKDLNNVGALVVIELNLASMKSIRDCCDKLLEKEERINLLINNAGVMASPDKKTEDGIEMQFGTNHLGHFLFTLLLLPKIIKSAPARIVNVSSSYHKTDINFNDLHLERGSYSALGYYQQSKLANILFTKELDRRLREANIEGVNVYVLHPGVIATDIQRNWDSTYFKGFAWMFFTLGKFFIKTPVEGAQTTIYCAIDEEAGNQSGLYYSDCKPAKPSRKADNMDTAKKLWDVSVELANLTKYDPFK